MIEMPKQIKIIILPEGNVKMETSGFQGNICITEADRILKELEKDGIKPTKIDRKYTPEFYQKQAQAMKR